MYREACVTIPENTTAVATLATSDPDNGDAVTSYAVTRDVDHTWANAGDQEMFTVTDAGALAFKTPRDFENPGRHRDGISHPVTRNRSPSGAVAPSPTSTGRKGISPSTVR